MNNYKILNNYKKDALNLLKYNFPMVNLSVLSDAVDYSIDKRLKDSELRVHNNYNEKTIDSTILEMTEYILSRKPILTAFGVLYQKKAESINPIAKRIKGFMNDRKKLKKEMFKYPKGSEEREKYNLLQLLKKLDANGFYGLFGQSSCLFFNIYVATSITTQGRSLISSAGLFFESFLSNNVKFGSFDQLIDFINKTIEEERIYKDSDILDRDISVEECFEKIILSSGFNYVPDDKEMNIVWDILINLSQENINRLYYKNNLYEFLDNESMKKAIIYILSSMDMPFIVPQLSSLPDDVAVELKEFCNILKEYVYYGHEILDHFSKIDNMIRSSSVLLDTDSSLVSLDAWYRYVLDLIKDIDMPIKHMVVNPFEEIKCDEFGDYDLKKALIPVESDFDYNFYDDESIEFDRLAYPFKVIPQDGVRYSIINMMAYILETLVNDYMKRYCKKSFSDIDSQDPCLISMKNEYLFARLLLTSANKFYADLQELQEGNPVPKEVAMDIKGLPLAKNTLNPNSQKVLKEILYEDILNASSIDQVRIIKKLAKFEKDIYKSLSSGEKKFYKPANIKSINTYDDPMRINGIKAAIIWNELRDEDNEAIDMYGGRQAIDILKINITKACIPKIEEDHPDKAHKIEEIMHQYKQFEKCIDCIAIPKNEKAPSWILPYVDYNNLIISNCKDLPIESVGIMRSGNNNTYTNILKM